MQRLWDALGVDGDLWTDGWPRGKWMLPEAAAVGNPGILFEKIDDEKIAAQKERLAEIIAAASETD